MKKQEEITMENSTVSTQLLEVASRIAEMRAISG